MAASQSVRGRYPHTRCWHSLNARTYNAKEREIALDQASKHDTVSVKSVSQSVTDKDIAICDQLTDSRTDRCTNG